jgi:hypothetical protein
MGFAFVLSNNKFSKASFNTFTCLSVNEMDTVGYCIDDLLMNADVCYILCVMGHGRAFLQDVEKQCEGKLWLVCDVLIIWLMVAKSRTFFHDRRFRSDENRRAMSQSE